MERCSSSAFANNKQKCHPPTPCVAASLKSDKMASHTSVSLPESEMYVANKNLVTCSDPWPSNELKLIQSAELVLLQGPAS